MSNPSGSAIPADDVQAVCESLNIFLKPICKVHITVQISGLSFAGVQNKCLSTWEVAEKLRQLCPALLSPPIQLKVTGATVEFVRFVVELDSKADVKRVIKAADSQVSILNPACSIVTVVLYYIALIFSESNLAAFPKLFEFEQEKHPVTVLGSMTGTLFSEMPKI